MEKDDLIAIIAFIFLVIISGLFVCWSANYSCHKTANALGYKGNWGLGVGCVLEKPNGEKILKHNLRFIESKE